MIDQANEKSLCPYCDFTLKKQPQRKTKCPNCEKNIFVRKDYSKNQHLLLTSDEVAKYDSEKSDTSFIESTINNLSFCDLNYSDFEKIAKSSFDLEALRSLINSKILDYKKTSNFHYQKMLYFQLGLIDDYQGVSSFQALQESKKVALLKYKQDFGGNAIVSILTAGDDSCRSCQKTANIKLSINDALENMPIPNKDCTTKGYNSEGFCRCLYIVDSDYLINDESSIIIEKSQNNKNENQESESAPQIGGRKYDKKSKIFVILFFILLILYVIVKLNY